MLLKLDLNVTDDAGNAVKTCSILKCHKQEGDRVEYGDPLFDIEVSEILVPARLNTAWEDSQVRHRSAIKIANLVTAQLDGKETTSKKSHEDLFAFHKVSYRQIVALERGFVRKIYAQEGTVQKISRPLSLLATDGDLTNAEAGYDSSSEVLPFRFATRSLGLDAVLNARSERLAAKGKDSRQYLSGAAIMFWSEKERERRIGIFAKGGCDLPSVKACWPLIKRLLRGTCCITHEGVISDGRTDQLLQTLRDDLPWQAIDEVISKLKLQRHVFEPRIFQKSFIIDGPDGAEQFPLNVVILGSGSDLNRVLYRHREFGFLVDPGTGWLARPVEQVLNDLSVVGWFRRNFVSIGQITAEQYTENLCRVVEEVRERNGAHVMIFNNLSVDPRTNTHNYQFMADATALRRIEFKLALIEVSRKVGAPTIDVDRIIKKAGMEKMPDIAHFPASITSRIAEEIVGIMRDLRVF